MDGLATTKRCAIRQWIQIRGNAKWDILKWVSSGLLSGFVITVDFLRAGPSAEVWAVLLTGLASFFCFNFFVSKIANWIAFGLLCISAALLVFFSSIFNHKQPISAPAPIVQVKATTSGDGSPAYAAGRDLTVTTVPVNLPSTPIRDEAMRLVVELDWLGNNWPTNGLTPFKNIENFGDSAYPHWIIKVHNELQEHHQHSAKLDDVVRVLDRMGGQGLFTDTEKMTHPSAVLFGIRDEVKRLSEQIKE